MNTRSSAVNLVAKHIESNNFFTPHSTLFWFYLARLIASPNYGLVQGREIIKMVCRAAFNDNALNDKESNVIIETCLDPELDNILLEVNYNEGWQ